MANNSPSGDLISVVIPARNEAAHIGATLDSVRAQTHTNLQIIVVDNASTDDTARIVRSHSDQDDRVELLTNPDISIPTSLNVALAVSEGRWFVRVDAHSTIPPDYVDKAVTRLEEGRWAGVGGRKDAVGTTPEGKAIAVALASKFGVGNSVYHYGTSMQTVDHIPFGSYRTDLLKEIGGWNDELVANEDYELDYRLRLAGHELLFDPAISISWECRQSLSELWRQYRRYGRGKADVAEIHPESLALRHLAAPALVATWLVAMALPGRHKKRRRLLAFGPYVAALALATRDSQQALDKDAAGYALPAAFAAMHVGWGVGFWEQLISNKLAKRNAGTSMNGRDSGNVVSESL